MSRLHEAVAAGNLEMVKSYLHAGDDVDMFSYVMLNGRAFYSSSSTVKRFKMTPLHLAVYINNSEMVDLLLDKGASLTIACSVNNDTTQFTALKIAIECEHIHLTSKFLSLDDGVKNQLIANLTPAQKQDFLDCESDELEDYEYRFHQYMESSHRDKKQLVKIIKRELASNLMLAKYTIFNTRQFKHSLPECTTSEKEFSL